jgi:ABC-type cobalamin/Fe3+-siderophores transport system ATPase subunit
MAQLELNGVVQRYGKTTIVDGVDFRLEKGKIACLLGPSGCGKTTLLRCIAGFEEIAGGEIRLHDKVVSSAGQRVAPEKRQIGMVFPGLRPVSAPHHSNKMSLSASAANRRRMPICGQAVAGYGRSWRPGRQIPA